MYTVTNGAVDMDEVGKGIRTRIHQLCSVQFGHEVLKTFHDLDKDKINAIADQIKREYTPRGPVMSNDWIKHQVVSVMSHRRSEVRTAVKKGKPKPTWLDTEEWRAAQQEYGDDPHKYQQQIDAARTRNESVGSSHLGSGGYETLRADFVSCYCLLQNDFLIIILRALICTNIFLCLDSFRW